MRAAIVEHGAHAAKDVAHDKVIPGAQGAVLHQHGSHGAAAAVQLGFQHHARSGTVGVRLDLLEIGHQADHFHQQIQVGLLLGRDVHEDRASAPVLGHQAAVGQLLLDPVGQGVGFVDLVDGHNQRHVRRLGVVDGFQRLGHHAVVGGYDQHDNIRDLRSAGAHAGERFVTGGVEEHDMAAERRRSRIGNLDLIGADVLRNAAGFAARHIRVANGVQQRGFAVVHVAHDGDYRRTNLAAFFGVHRNAGFGGGFLGRLLLEGDDRGVRAEVAGHIASQLRIERLIDGGEDAPRQQPRDHILGAHAEQFGQILDADAFGDRDGARDRHRLIGRLHPRRRNEALHRAFLHPARHITLAGTARRTARPCSGPRRRAGEALFPDLRQGGELRRPGNLPGRMQSSPLPGAHRRTHGASGSRWPWPLEDRLSRHRTARLRARCNRGAAAAAELYKPAVVRSAA